MKNTSKHRYERLFADLQARGEGAFVPFVMLGDPGPEISLAIIDALVAGGADALELGIPFSDPVADGPVIQQAANRALAAGVTPGACFELLKIVRAKYPEIAIGLLVYSNLVVHDEAADFYRLAAESGVDSVLVADVPGVELAPFVAAARRAGIDQILIVPPNATPTVFARVAEFGSGYTYLLGRAGVTGTEASMQVPAQSLVAALREAGAPPALLGFGISTPEHVRAALTAGAVGAISGSAVVGIVERNLENTERMLTELAEFVRVMKSATRQQ